MGGREWGKTAEPLQVAFSGGEHLILPAAPALRETWRQTWRETWHPPSDRTGMNPMMLDEPRPRQGGRDHAVNGGRLHVGIVAGIISE